MYQKASFTDRGGTMRIKKKWAACILSMLLIFPGSVFIAGPDFASAEPSADGPSALEGIFSVVSQEGTVVEEGSTINASQPFELNLGFRVPVIGDDPEPSNPVKQGDTARIDIGKTLIPISTDSIEFRTSQGILVGHMNLKTDSVTGILYAEITFDGNESIFNGHYSDIECEAWLDLRIDPASIDEGGGGSTIEIVGKEYTVIVPHMPEQYNVKKTGSVFLGEKQVEWEVILSGSKGTAALDLAGKTFFDDLSGVGDYVTGSFTVDGSPAVPNIVDNALSYVIPDGHESPVTIKFRTKIDDDHYYIQNDDEAQSITNKALIKQSEETLAEGKRTVEFSPRWIEKAGESSDAGSTGVYDPTNRTITWTIIANQMGRSLANAAIIDAPPDGLTHISSTVQYGTGEAWSDPATIMPDENGKYELGNINGPVLLTITTGVPDSDITTGITTWKNSASIQWDGQGGSGIPSNEASVGVGYNAITKSGELDAKSRTVTWKVRVDARSQNIPGLKVYDLLVYGSVGSGFDASIAEGFPTGLDLQSIKPQYGQRYSGGFQGDGTMVLHPIVQNGIRVADLLAVTDLSTTTANEFTFESLILDEDIFAGNTVSSVFNTANLFSDNAKLNEATAPVEYDSHILSKAMLSRSVIENPTSGVNNAVTESPSEGFDYVENAAVFRLEINATGLHLSDAEIASGKTLGKITVTDVLPEGWEFTEIGEGKLFYLFEGVGQADGSITATGAALPTTDGLNATVAGRQATFTFDPLDGPYVILVKARLTDERVQEYFSKSQIIIDKNTVTMRGENWESGPSASQDVRIESKLFSKDIIRSADGVLLWTINYQPHAINKGEVSLRDTIPDGIELRINFQGNLLFEDDNIVLTEMRLLPDGTYEPIGRIDLESGDIAHYDNNTRTFTVKIPDSSRSYRLTYITDITAEAGTTINNSAELIGTDVTEEEASVLFEVADKDARASMKSANWLQIEKTDTLGSFLSGAAFELLALDGETVIRRGISDSNGIIRMKSIPVGAYILLESAAPDGFVISKVRHSVIVTSETNGSMKVSINGAVGGAGNTLSVKNDKDGTVGNVLLRKSVYGNAGERDRLFTFTFNTDAEGTYAYEGYGMPFGTIRDGDTIELAHGQWIIIYGLPIASTYSFMEHDYSFEGYETFSVNAEGIIGAEMHEASFENTKEIELPLPLESKADAPLVATGDITMPIGAVIIATAALAVWLVIGVWKFLLPRKKK